MRRGYFPPNEHNRLPLLRASAESKRLRMKATETVAGLRSMGTQTSLDTWEAGDLNGKTRKTLSTVYAHVVKLCKDFPSCTGNYNILIERYRKTYNRRYWENFFEDKKFKKIPSPETVCRLFRKAVENGEIHPSGKILARRKAREKIMHAAMLDFGDDSL